MSQNGEKELVLGNNQLLGLFFVLMAICAVAFSLGYMVGKNSVAPKEAASIAPPETTTTTTVIEPPPTPAPQSQIANDPAASGSQPAPVKEPEPAPAPEPPQPKGGVALSTPASGESYVQVAATKRPDSDNIVKSLRDQKFHAILTESSKEGLYRVLVGPYEKTAEKAAAKDRLKALGFSSAVIYTAK